MSYVDEIREKLVSQLEQVEADAERLRAAIAALNGQHKNELRELRGSAELLANADVVHGVKHRSRKVSSRNGRRRGKSPDRQRQAIELFAERPGLPTSQVAAGIGMSDHTYSYKIVKRLKEQALIEPKDGGWQLTDAGRRFADQTAS